MSDFIKDNEQVIDEPMTLREQVMLEQALLRRRIAMPDHEAGLQRILSQSSVSNSERSQRHAEVHPLRRLWWVAAAVVVAIAVVAISLIDNNAPQLSQPSIVEYTAAAPIEGLSVPSPSRVSVTKPVAVSAPRCKIYHFTLPDGTQVWLNSESQLYYPAQFQGDERRVRLVGEGFFSVKKDPDCPFVVESDQLTTTAYGTTFNMRTYSDEECHVTLLDGCVTVASDEGRQCVQLAPGEDAVMDGHGQLSVSQFDTESYERWSDGYFYYDGAPLADVLRDLSRWYNVTLTADTDSLDQLRIHFVASWQEMDLDTLTELLESFTGVRIKRKLPPHW